MAFREISVEQLKDNPFTLINKDWMLITAGDAEKHNTMTASWGGVGELWGKYVSTIYIRPQRYTLEFVEREEYYSLCFFGPEYRQAPEPVREQIRPGRGQGRRHRPDPLLRPGRPLLRAGAAGVPLPQAVPPGYGEKRLPGQGLAGKVV